MYNYLCTLLSKNLDENIKVDTLINILNDQYCVPIMCNIIASNELYYNNKIMIYNDEQELGGFIER